MAKLGIISGTLLRQTTFYDSLRPGTVKTPFGKALLLQGDDAIFIPRHGIDEKSYILPHLINHQANLLALRQRGVEAVISLNSTGALKIALKPGRFVVPDDFILPDGGPTIFSNQPVHITPTLSEPLRRRILQVARQSLRDVTDGGVYWQTRGPRLETKAEIRMMSKFADIVGMTMASEAVIAKELGLSYAALCSVDNYAHGIARKALSMEEINKNARCNSQAAIKFIEQLLKG
ncbi:MAG: MTAP family purine nucleoside phosphorylase [Smithellaceae bacterium]|nr:MTAP family purine nucleoside phosphorylase [Smithellaceae bacterium]